MHRAAALVAKSLHQQTLLCRALFCNKFSRDGFSRRLNSPNINVCFGEEVLDVVLLHLPFIVGF